MPLTTKAGDRIASDEDRFWVKVVPDPISGCWLWSAYVQGSGHGKFGIGSVVYCAHRIAWEWVRGPLPDGYDVHHVCHNPSCVNVDHLQALPMAEHRALTQQLDGPSGMAAIHAAKSACPQGHPYDAKDRRGRYCTVCRREYKRQWQRQKYRQEASK